MSIPYKINVRVAGHEFFAEGPEDSVRADYREFILCVQPIVALTISKAKPSDTQPAIMEPIVRADDDQLNDDEIKRLFRTTGDEGLSLRILPKTDNPDADAILVTLLGWNLIYGFTEMSALSLMTSLRQSGVSLDRIDRTAAQRSDYVNVSGAKRGTRYALNNRGITFATGLARDMLK